MERAFSSLSEHGLAPTHAGKVREILDLGDLLLIVTSDRISAFDCILPTPIPGKGKLLNKISAHWFRGLASIVPTHMVSDEDADFPQDLEPYRDLLKDRWVLVRKAERISVECIVRGYLAGSGMQEYRKHRTVGGIQVPAGIPDYGKLPEPLFTPTTKADVGHDEPITFEQLCDEVGGETGTALRDLSLRVYDAAEGYARSRGLILADTKFEFGWIDGAISLIDEVLTPDSSRYWDQASYDAGHPDPLDKEYIRAYLKTLTWDRNPPAPGLPEEQVAETYRRYRTVHDRLGVGGAAPELSAPGSAS